MFHMEPDSGNHLAFVKPEITTDSRTSASPNLAKARCVSFLVRPTRQSALACRVGSICHQSGVAVPTVSPATTCSPWISQSVASTSAPDGCQPCSELLGYTMQN